MVSFSYADRSTLFSGTALVVLLLLMGCTGSSSNKYIQNDWQLDPAVVAEVQALEVADVDSGLMEVLKAELLRSISEYGRDKVVSTPPTGADNSIDDLAGTPDGSGSLELTWTYRNVGDYDQNSEVNSADITRVD